MDGAWSGRDKITLWGKGSPGERKGDAVLIREMPGPEELGRY
jgi:hypothetical protein